MKKYLLGSAVVSAAFIILPAIASASVVYDATPSPLPPNIASLGFQATQTAEFGDYVHLAGTDRILTTVNVTMSDWALASTPANQTFCLTPGNCDSTGFFWPITVNIYSNSLDVNGVPTTLLATKTVTQHIPWRPEADNTCLNPTQWKATDNNCYNGKAFNLSFDLSSLNVTLPSDVIVGVAYNTQTWGASPTTVDGPYNSLNVGVPTGQTASVGTDDNADQVYWSTMTGSNYSISGLTGVFRLDTGWIPNGTVAIQINARGCTQTGFLRDGINMTAAIINPSSVTGDVNAGGCNIGIYYGQNMSGIVSNANIHGANYYGVVIRGNDVTVQNSNIHDIGETPLNGSQHGVGIYVANITGATNGDCKTTDKATAIINGNTLSSYQKGGIVVTCDKTSATVTNNVVTGVGPVNYIAQNGIQVSFNASALLKGNTVSGHWYTPATVVSCGILFFNAGGVKASSNNVFNNQMNQCNFGGKGGGKYTPAQ